MCSIFWSKTNKQGLSGAFCRSGRCSSSSSLHRAPPFHQPEIGRAMESEQACKLTSLLTSLLSHCISQGNCPRKSQGCVFVNDQLHSKGTFRNLELLTCVKISKTKDRSEYWFSFTFDIIFNKCSRIAKGSLIWLGPDLQEPMRLYLRHL